MSELHAEQIAVHFIAQWEGCRLDAYWDSIGECWTIGYGHTACVTNGDHITQELAERLLMEDVSWAFHDVIKNVHVTLSENQFAALISWQFNTGAPQSSGVYLAINANEFEKAMEFLAAWNKGMVGGVLQEIPGLTNRRTAEVKLFNS
jgi:lysozyme